jgi:hypothetical protein
VNAVPETEEKGKLFFYKLGVVGDLSMGKKGNF